MLIQESGNEFEAIFTIAKLTLLIAILVWVILVFVAPALAVQSAVQVRSRTERLLTA